MKSRKQIWIAVLSLFSALAIAVAFTPRASSVHAGKHTSQINQSALAQPAAYVSGPSLRAAFAADSMLLNSAGAQRVPTLALGNNPLLPEVEEFSLTPPNPVQSTDKTTLSVRFPESAAEQLPSQIPITLAGQNVVMLRSDEDASVFFTRIDFNWTAFLKQQQRRKQLASQGKTVPIYKGRNFIRKETIQFIDPADIQHTLQTRQPLQFTSEVLVGGSGDSVVPDHELMIVNPAVVEDLEGSASRTYDACIQGSDQGNPQGAWTFQTLWMAALNTTSVQVAEQALDDFLSNWQNSLTINNFQVSQRPGMGALGGMNGLLANWPTTSDTCTENGVQGPCPSLVAPVRLNAIVNRIDLAGQPNQTAAGELRFVFGVTAGNQSGQRCLSEGNQPISGPPFNIIFEYHVPSGYTAASWAQQWNSLPKDNFDYTSCPPDGCYIPLLQSTITDNVVKSTSCGGNTCLFHVRTNEVLLTGSTPVWELREFGVNYGTGGNPNTISEITVDQTPDGSFNFGGGGCVGHLTNGEPACNTTDPNFPTTWLNNNQITIDQFQGTQPLLPLNTTDQAGVPFLGGSSLNSLSSAGVSAVYWNVCVRIDKNCTATLQNNNNAHEARRYFSLNTCNGCHGDETNPSNLFQQVFNRTPGQQSSLSTFLLGCVPSSGSCSYGNAGPDSCTVGSMGTQQGDQCNLNTPGQESVLDPDNGVTGNNSYGDLARRQVFLQGLLGGAEPLLPFIRPHIGVH